jgi:hypothetical protein
MALTGKRLILLALIVITLGTKVFAQVEDVSARFYFPGSVGISCPLINSRTTLNNGLSVNTAIEYRPTYINDMFFRIDYDALNNNYTGFARNIPTNIIKGKLSTDFLIIGAGYRQKFGRWGLYGLLQPGLGMHSYERAVNTSGGVVLNNVTSNSLALKGDIGIEYYITPHFAAVFDPSLYKIFSNSGFNLSHSQFGALNIGITTTIF